MNRRFFVIVGVVAGAVIMAFLVQAYHMSASPKVCLACHSMVDVGSSWHASHHKQFACTECHMPDANVVARLLYKTRAGLHDLWHETLRDYPASLTLSPSARAIVNANCLRCHESTVERVTMWGRGPISCTKCHRHTMHHKSKTMEE